MEQEVVKIIGFRTENNGIIKAVVLTPDVLQKRLICIKGESGNGKSTLIKALQTAVSGTNAIANKNILEAGYISEALLVDNDLQIYVGAKVTNYTRGENAGEPKFETFLYAKDANGKPYAPIIDGEVATPGSYVKKLTTELTFNMPALSSKSTAEHGDLIMKLFKPEFDKLDAQTLISKIEKLRKERDAARLVCQSAGAYMSRFEDEGYTETGLAILKRTDIEAIDAKILEAKIQKDRMTSGSADKYNLAVERLKNERKDKLQEIKDKGVEARSALEKDNLTKKQEYDKLLDRYNYNLKTKETLFSDFEQLLTSVRAFLSQDIVSVVEEMVIKDRDKQAASLEIVEPQKPVEDPILKKAVDDRLAEYKELEAKPLDTVSADNVDTTEQDALIEKYTKEKETGVAINKVYDRYQMWKEWMKAQTDYDLCVDQLKKLYASIDTGVVGMKIVPVETDAKTEIWLQYDGSFDTEFFHNEEKELRFIYQYSSFQISAIGVMLQAARLNLKPKALRLAIVDEVAFTDKGLAVLGKLCEDLQVQLITAKTDDYDKDNIKEGEIVIEGGEIFFSNTKTN